jgi:hypothetical protein
MILAALGLDPDKDVGFLVTGPSASRFAALSSGMVDATSLAPPFTLAARKAGYNFFDNVPGLREAEPAERRDGDQQKGFRCATHCH